MSAYPPEKASHPGSGTLPSRPTGGLNSDDEAVPDADPTDTAGILLERLQAWKHACGYLEDYISATEKMQKAHSKEYEKVLKTISNPLKEGHHFDQSLGGIAGLFENMRTNTQSIADSHLETSKGISTAILPILARLHQEIKSKAKELNSGAVKGSKSVASARNSTQKHIELLGQHSAAYDSSGGKMEPQSDPYVLQRGLEHRLNKQVLEENTNRNDLIVVQEDFQRFEAHIIQTIQQAFGTFLQYIGGQADRQKILYTDIVGTTQCIPLEFEWMNFLHRNGNLLIDPKAPQRSMTNITYPNQNHASTQPMIAGTLERKSRAMGGLTGYKSGYYVVTPSKFMHQFENADNFKKDPTPELSLYLPDCTIGAVSGERFNIKGKDTKKGVGSAFQMTHELSFKAHSPADAEKWWAVISGLSESDQASVGSGTTSPISGRNVSGPPAYMENRQAPALQTQGLPAGQSQASAEGALSSTTPSSAAPRSASGASPGTVTSPTMQTPTSTTGKATMM